MKKLLVFVSIIATNSLFASTITLEALNKQEIVDILVKNDILIERELSPSRVAPISREVRKNRLVRIVRNSREVRENRLVRIVRNSREVRKNRLVRMGRNSRGLRLERVVHVIHEIPEKKEHSQKITSLI